MTASRILDHVETAKIIGAAQDFVEAARRSCRTVYPDFDALPDAGKTAILMSHTIQALVTPGAFNANEIDVNFAAYAVGVALGCRSSSLPDDHVNTILSEMARGFVIGRDEVIKAAFAVQTAGNA